MSPCTLHGTDLAILMNLHLPLNCIMRLLAWAIAAFACSVVSLAAAWWLCGGILQRCAPAAVVAIALWGTFLIRFESIFHLNSSHNISPYDALLLH